MKHTGGDRATMRQDKLFETISWSNNSRSLCHQLELIARIWEGSKLIRVVVRYSPY